MSTTNQDDVVSSTSEEVDDEGFRVNGYDVIIAGTGLVHSIIASALARAGKSVLHIDSNDFYGETDAVFSLDALIEWSSKLDRGQPERSNIKHELDGVLLEPFSSFRIHSASHSASAPHAHLAEGIEVVTPFGHGVVEAMPTLDDSKDCTSSLAVRLKHWKLTNGLSPVIYFGPPPFSVFLTMRGNVDQFNSFLSNYYAANLDIIPVASLQYQQLIHSSVAKSFALDLTPSLLFAQGDAVQGIVQSSVSDYCEFKNMLGLYILLDQEGHSSKKIDSTFSDEYSSTRFKLSQVPSSKGDIFSSKLLSPVDKRKLMKFLQLALDFAVSTQDTDASDTKDKERDVGQNSDPNSSLSVAPEKLTTPSEAFSTTSPIDEEKVSSLNERELHMGRSLYRPQNKAINTNDLELLYQSFQNNMTFDKYLEAKHGLSAHLRDIVVYAMALSSSPQPEYSTLMGMLDLSKHLLSLGRYGNTGFLTPMYGSGELCQAFCRSAAVHGATYVLRRKPKRLVLSKDGQTITGIELYPNVENMNDNLTVMNNKETVIKAKNVVIPSNLISSTHLLSKPLQKLKRKRMIRRISILRNKLISNGNDSRHAEQRHVIIIPPHTLGNEYPIHGVVLDESVHVAPWSIGGEYSVTVLHLSTVVYESEKSTDESESCERGHKSLERAVRVLTETQSAGREEFSISNELYHFAFSYAYAGDEEMNPNDMLYQGLFSSNWQGGTLTMDSAFHEAKKIFESICPGHVFLTLSKDLAAMLHELQLQKHASDDDDDGVILQNAMNMMDKNQLTDT